MKPGSARKIQRGLSKADLQLWSAFTQDIALLPGKTRLVVEPEPKLVPSDPILPAMPAKPQIGAGAAAARWLQANSAPAGLDASTWKSFSSGRLKAASRLDLHGHTATRAHHAVQNFIEAAYIGQIRCVEIITGKGDVLLRELPHWLNGPGLRRYILATAHPHAGNTGSLRILLRRARGAPG